jgi:hypothetical protein
VTGCLALAGVLWAGCGQTRSTELVAGISSQVSVPNYLKNIVVTVYFGGANYFRGYYPVYDAGSTSAHVILPRTLGVLEGTQNGPVTVTVAGYLLDPSTDPAAGAFNGSDPEVGTTTQPVENGGGAVILRRSTQEYTEGQTLYLPMPLHFSCYSVDCDSAPGCENQNCTCKAGECVDATTDPSTLPPYNDGLAYGTTATCFRPFTDTGATGQQQPGCMDYEITPQVVGNPSDCVFSLPTCTGSGNSTTCSTPGAGPYLDPNFPSAAFVAAASAGGGLNVRAVFDNSVSEVLDYEGTCPTAWPPTSGANPQDGYCNYADAPQKFRLAPGLCKQFLGQSATHLITLLEASGTCPSKTPFQPICDDSIQGPPQPDYIDGGVNQGDGGCIGASPVALRPAESGLYMLFTKTAGTSQFFGSKALAQVLGQSLTDPVFQRTHVALMYPPAQQSDCLSSADPTGASNAFALDVTPDSGVANLQFGAVPFEFSSLAQADIATSLLAQGAAIATALDAGTDAGLPSSTAPWYLEAALAGSYQALLALDPQQQFNRKAVMLFYDSDFNVAPSNDCAGALDPIAEAAQAAGKGIETYAVYLANAEYDLPDGGTIDGGPGVPGDPVGHGGQLAQGAVPGGQYFFNAKDPTKLESVAGQAMASVIADLGSCVYEWSPIFAPGATISFPDYDTYLNPPAGQTRVVSTVNVAFARSCAADDAQNNPLYVLDNGHIRICQNTCKRLVTSTTDDEILSGQRNAGRPVPLPDLPLEVTWSYSCAAGRPDAGPGPLEAGAGSAPISVADAGSDAGTDAASDDSGSATDSGGD